MFARLSTSLKNCIRMIQAFSTPIMARIHEKERESLLPRSTFRSSKRADDTGGWTSANGGAGDRTNPNDEKIIGTQKQLTRTMLKLMVVACGGNVDGSARRNGTKPKP